MHSLQPPELMHAKGEGPSATHVSEIWGGVFVFCFRPFFPTFLLGGLLLRGPKKKKDV